MNFKYSSLLPIKFSDWVKAISFVIYFTIHITMILFFDMTWLDMGESEPLEHWLLRVARDIFFAVFIISIIGLGIRNVRQNGKTFSNLITPAIGVVICILLGFGSWYAENAFSNFKNNFFCEQECSILDNLRKKLESPDLPIDKKTRVSAIYAKWYYRYYGEQIEYLSQDGTSTLYQPTEEEKDEHKEYAVGMKNMNWIIRSMHRTKYLWLSVLVISLLLGFMTPIKKRRRNSSYDRFSGVPPQV